MINDGPTSMLVMVSAISSVFFCLAYLGLLVVAAVSLRRDGTAAALLGVAAILFMGTLVAGPLMNMVVVRQMDDMETALAMTNLVSSGMGFLGWLLILAGIARLVTAGPAPKSPREP